VDPHTTKLTIAAPREALFGYLADVANVPEFADHLMEDVRLLREDTVGSGAGLRFKLKGARFNRFPWADLTWVELDQPRRLLGVGRMGKFNRIRILYDWVLEPEGAGATRVALTVRTQPKTSTDRLIEAVGTGRALRRGWGKSLKRLRTIFEEDGRGRGTRASVAGGPRKPATGSPLNPLVRR
jgi:uncharacterized protein YndB with AHSA1/START domain